jgi:hypothetical protein
MCCLIWIRLKENGNFRIYLEKIRTTKNNSDGYGQMWIAYRYSIKRTFGEQMSARKFQDMDKELIIKRVTVAHV